MLGYCHVHPLVLSTLQPLCWCSNSLWGCEVCSCAGHFDVYLGDLFDEVAGEQAKFFLETFEAPMPVVEATEALPLL